MSEFQTTTNARCVFHIVPATALEIAAVGRERGAWCRGFATDAGCRVVRSASWNEAT